MREVIPAPVPGLDLRREYGHHQSPAIRAVSGSLLCYVAAPDGVSIELMQC